MPAGVAAANRRMERRQQILVARERAARASARAVRRAARAAAFYVLVV